MAKSSSEETILIAWKRRGFSDETARRLRAELLAYKSSIAKGANSLGGKPSASEKRNRRRHAEEKYRKRLKKLFSDWPIIWTRRAVTTVSVQREPILDALWPRRIDRWRPIFERQYKTGTIELDSFSFVDNPAETILTLKKIAEFETSHTEGRLDFKDADCPDIGPFLVLQAMHQAMLPIFGGGEMARSTQRVLEAVGLRNALGMTFQQSSPSDGVWPLPFRTRSPQGRGTARLLRTQTSELVATEVIERINTWLGKLANVELNEEGERLVLSMTGEALNNAERHSDPDSIDGSWSLAGFMTRKRGGGAVTYRCHLALLSTGVSIAESMSTAGEQTKARMAEYVTKHRSMFGNFSEENLQTVFALQDGVSRVYDAIIHGRGGTGLMDIIDFFAALSGGSGPQEEPPRLAIVSGSTCILLRPPYIAGIRAEGPAAIEGLRQPRQLWFNPSNTADEPPDRSHVISLPAKLSGTLVTMAWTTSEEHLNRTKNEAPRAQ